MRRFLEAQLQGGSTIESDIHRVPVFFQALPEEVHGSFVVFDHQDVHTPASRGRFTTKRCEV
jgi:hypothetical protein